MTLFGRAGQKLSQITGAKLIMIIKCPACRNGLQHTVGRSLSVKGDLISEDRYVAMAFTLQCQICKQKTTINEVIPLESLENALSVARTY